MNKLGTMLLLAIGLLAFTACGKKSNNNQNYNCGYQYGYSTSQCYNNPYGYNQGYGGQMCAAGRVSTSYGCLPQNNCPAGYGYHPTAYNGAPGCVQGTMYGGGGYNQYQQYGQYGGYNPYGQQYGGYGYGGYGW